MKQVHIPDLPWEELHSPTKKFHSFCRNLSMALGGIRNTGTWGGGHPFDLQIRRIPAGAAICPFHLHVGQWELFLARSGSGFVRTTEGRTPVKTGDAFYHPPGTPHQLFAADDSDLEVLIVADNPPVDACHYPDSNKWSLRPPAKLFRMTETDYFDGEDDSGSDERQQVDPPARSALAATVFRIAPSPVAAPIAPFAQRKLQIDDLAWEDWSSPKGKFRASFAQISETLGAKRNTPTALGGHPFDLELGKLSPGQCGCPFHSHAAQWELFLFLSGTATVRTPEGTTTARAGDVVLHPPGEAHQFTNTGNDEVRYLLVADNPLVDVFHYPDSDKWGLRSPRKFFRAVDTDYWDGEE